MFNIKTALNKIDEEIYKKTLRKLADDKWKNLKGEQYLNRQAKTINYLLQKGYEPQLVYVVVNEIKEAAKEK